MGKEMPVITVNKVVDPKKYRKKWRAEEEERADPLCVNDLNLWCLPWRRGVHNAGLPDFPWYNISKQEKIQQQPQNLPNGH
jgi:hypothetical protein